MTIREARTLRKALQKDAVRTLEALGWSRDKIGRELGYKDRQMVDKIMQDNDILFGGDQTLLLTRLASKHGNDAPADHFSANGKISVPVMWEIDGDLSNEIRDIMQCAGIGSAAFERNDETVAVKHSEHLVNAAMGFRTEIYNRFKSPYANVICGRRF